MIETSGELMDFLYDNIYPDELVCIRDATGKKHAEFYGIFPDYQYSWKLGFAGAIGGLAPVLMIRPDCMYFEPRPFYGADMLDLFEDAFANHHVFREEPGGFEFFDHSYFPYLDDHRRYIFDGGIDVQIDDVNTFTLLKGPYPLKSRIWQAISSAAFNSG